MLKILEEGLNHRDNADIFLTNISLGVILSTPSLLYPSSSSRPSKQSQKMVITALAERLSQVTHQEAAVRSLVKIRDSIGLEDFDFYLSEYNPSVKTEFNVLCQAYKLNHKPKKGKKLKKKSKKKLKNQTEELIDKKDYKNEIACKENFSSTTIPPSRIVLETEIKFNEETAITMTILEQKDDESDAESSEGINSNEENENDEVHLTELNDEPKDVWIERRKTPRRVHFGGEIVKLRTPDSDDSEMIQVEVPATRIPVPISPVTKMPIFRPIRSRSNPCSPNVARSKLPRRARSVSNSPKREIYVHDGSLSPKKSILSKNPIFGEKFVDKGFRNKESDVFGIKESDRSWSFEVFDDIDERQLDQERNLFLEKIKKTKKNKKTLKINSAKRRGKIEKSEDLKKIESSIEAINQLNFIENPEVKVDCPNLVNQSQSPVSLFENIETPVNEDILNDKSEKNLQNFGKIPTDTFKQEEEEVLNEKQNHSTPENAGSFKKFEDKTRSPPRKLAFESFPRQERNYILMELSSPVKGNSRSREVSPQGVQLSEHSPESKTLSSDPLSIELNAPTTSNEVLTNAGASSMKKTAYPITIKPEIDEEIQRERGYSGVKTKNFVNLDNNESRTASSSDGEVKFQEASWEELGLVDQDVLHDLHNKVRSICIN